jgi:hypothetical protein
MSERSFFGMSGQFAVLSLFLRRGYNVAVPVVDVGDDAIVIDDGVHELRRLQVKSGNPGKATEHSVDVQFRLSRGQLRDTEGAELYYMLMAWTWGRWSFVLISREELYKLKDRRQGACPGKRSRRGRWKRDEDAGDDLKLGVRFMRDPATGQEDAILWGESLRPRLNEFPPEWPDLQPGRRSPGPRPPGSRRTRP